MSSPDKLPDSKRINFQTRLQMARNMRDYINKVMIPAFNLKTRFEALASVPLSIDNVWVLIKNLGAPKDDDPNISILIYDDLSWYYKERLPKGSKKTSMGFKTEKEEDIILSLMKWLSKRSGIEI